MYGLFNDDYVIMCYIMIDLLESFFRTINL